MPPKVLYPKKPEAIEYKNSLPPELGATVVGVDSNKDGTIDSWEVKTKPFRHRGLNPEEYIDPEAARQQEQHLTDAEAARPPRDEEDELGYRQGGMSFTERGPISYSKGGAVKGKTFRGSF